MAYGMWQMANEPKVRIGAQRLKNTGIMKMPGEFKYQPLARDWTKIPKLKQANSLGCKLYI